MKRIHIVIADTDISFVISVAGKFAQQYAERIDLEAITDLSYFEHFFSGPKEMDLLIIAESLYDQRLEKHNIEKVLLLTEEENTFWIKDARVFEIYKYSGLKELFQLIESKDLGIFTDQETGRNNTSLILVTSASGGCGKTTLALALCTRLARDHHRVLYLDAEELPDASCLPEGPASEGAALYAGVSEEKEDFLKTLKSLIQRSNEKGFDYLPPMRGPLSSSGLSMGIYEILLAVLKGSREYDEIIVDTDHVLSEEKARLLTLADRILLLSKPEDSAVKRLDSFLNHLSDVREPRYLLVLNDMCNGNDESVMNISGLTVQSRIRHMEGEEQVRAAELCKAAQIRDLAVLLSQSKDLKYK